MKLFFLFCSLFFISATGSAQVTSLNEAFDVSCATSTGANYPTYWTGYCPFSPASVLGWNCSPLGGRSSTPGFECNSYISGVHYVDTAWLFTPKLDLSGYNDHIYLRYDSKYEFNASRLSVLVSHDYIKYTRPDTAGVDWTEVGALAMPVIGHDDSLDWVTHYIDLTPYKGTPLYVAFKYTSTNTMGGRWTIDNVMTTTWGLSVKDISNNLLPVHVLGQPTANNISIACTFAHPGAYSVTITDLIGREVYSGEWLAGSGPQNYTIDGAHLAAGMHFIKISDGNAYGVTKAIVE